MQDNALAAKDCRRLGRQHRNRRRKVCTGQRHPRGGLHSHMSDVLPETDLSTYYDERMMAAMSEHMTEALDRIVAMQNGEEDAQMPVS